MAMANIEKLPSGHYRVTVQLAGVRRRGTAPTKAEASRLRARLLAELETDTSTTARRARPGQRTATVGELVDMHIAQAGYAATTHADLTAIAKRIPTTLTALAVVDVRPSDLDGLYTALTAAGWSTHRVHRVHELLSAAFTRAVRWGWIPANPARSARPPRIERREVRPPEPVAVSRILAAINTDPMFTGFVRLAAVTGARRGELCGLQWGDIDLDTGTVVIRRSVAYTPAAGVVVKDTKTGAKGRRVVHIDPVTVTALRRLRASDAKRLLAVGLRLEVGSWVFSDRYGTQPWRPDRPTQRWVRLRDALVATEVARAAAAGATPDPGVLALGRVRLHDLRHLVATELLAAGVDHATVAGRLGHSSPRTTLGIYGHTRPERDIEAADIIAARLAN